MPLDSRSDGPQLVQTPGGETLQAYVPGHIATASVELVERIQRNFLTALETELSEALQTPVAATLNQARRVAFSAILDQAEPGVV